MGRAHLHNLSRLIFHSATSFVFPKSVDVCGQLTVASEDWSLLKCKSRLQIHFGALMSNIYMGGIFPRGPAGSVVHCSFIAADWLFWHIHRQQLSLYAGQLGDDPAPPPKERERQASGVRRGRKPGLIPLKPLAAVRACHCSSLPAFTCYLHLQSCFTFTDLPWLLSMTVLLWFLLQVGCKFSLGLILQITETALITSDYIFYTWQWW